MILDALSQRAPAQNALEGTTTASGEQDPAAFGRALEGAFADEGAQGEPAEDDDETAVPDLVAAVLLAQQVSSAPLAAEGLGAGEVPALTAQARPWQAPGRPDLASTPAPELMSSVDGTPAIEIEPAVEQALHADPAGGQAAGAQAAPTAARPTRQDPEAEADAGEDAVTRTAAVHEEDLTPPSALAVRPAPQAAPSVSAVEPSGAFVNLDDSQSSSSLTRAVERVPGRPAARPTSGKASPSGHHLGTASDVVSSAARIVSDLASRLDLTADHSPLRLAPLAEAAPAEADVPEAGSPSKETTLPSSQHDLGVRAETGGRDPSAGSEGSASDAPQDEAPTAHALGEAESVAGAETAGAGAVHAPEPGRATSDAGSTAASRPVASPAEQADVHDARATETEARARRQEAADLGVSKLTARDVRAFQISTADLGRVAVRTEQQDKLDVAIVTEDAAASRVVANAIPALRRELGEASLGSVQVSVASDASSHDRRGSSRERAPENRRSHDDVAAPIAPAKSARSSRVRIVL